LDATAIEFAYITTHVRMNTRGQIHSWTPSEIMEAFCMLPPPAIPLADWAARMKLEPETPANKQAPAPLTEEEEMKANAAGLAVLSAIAKTNPVIKIENI
jgi:hypothetical protein